MNDQYFMLIARYFFMITAKQNIYLSATICFAMLSTAQAAGNQQTVELNGGAVNMATNGGTAVMNISSTKNASVVNGNAQQVVIQGAVINSAAHGAYSELNIASRTGSHASGSQIVSVKGPVVTQASGKGVH